MNWLHSVFRPLAAEALDRYKLVRSGDLLGPVRQADGPTGEGLTGTGYKKVG
jgi:hypothetical protein